MVVTLPSFYHIPEEGYNDLLFYKDIMVRLEA